LPHLTEINSLKKSWTICSLNKIKETVAVFLKEVPSLNTSKTSKGGYLYNRNHLIKLKKIFYIAFILTLF